MSILGKINGLDCLLALIAILATILATKQAGSVLSGSDLKDLYGALLIYATTSAPGRTTPPPVPATDVPAPVGGVAEPPVAA